MKQPDQKVFDAVIFFVDTTAELESEPFFSLDEPHTVSMHAGKYTFRMGDRTHFKSALITFRRIWMLGEPESFKNINDIAIAHLEGFEKEAFQIFAKEIRQLRGKGGSLINLSVSGELLIELWLNAVFAHSGLDGKDPKRPRFDALVEKHGHGLMEYAMRHLIRGIGNKYITISKLVLQPLLARWTENFPDLKPSHRRGSAFGTKRREKTKEGHLVIRQSSSEYFSEESFEQRYDRILGRFSELKSVLKTLELSDRELSKLVLKHESIEPLLAEADIALELVSQMPLDPQEMFQQASGPCSFVGLTSENEYSGIRFTEDTAAIDARGLEILNSLYRVFREHLMRA